MQPAPPPSYEQIALFSDDIARMFEGGLLDEEAIFTSAARNTYSPQLATLSNFVADEIAAGRSVAAGFRCFESVLAPTFVRIIEKAERSDNLAWAFSEIAGVYHWAAERDRRGDQIVKGVTVASAILGGIMATCLGAVAIAEARGLLRRRSKNL